jgi:hypothetical protein
MSNKPVLTNEQTGEITGGGLSKNNTDTVDPVAGNDNTQGYAKGSLWTNETSGAIFVCTDTATGAAVWIAAGGSAGDMEAATYDPGGAAADAFARGNHTGTQPASSISDFDTEVGNHPDVAANTTFVGGDGAANTTHRTNTANPHGTSGANLSSGAQPATKVLETDGVGGFVYIDTPAGGGGGTPGGADRDIQINDGGAFGVGAEGGFKLGADKALSVFGESNSSSAIDNAPLGKGTLSVGYQQGNSSGTARIGNATNRGGVSFGSMQFNTGASGNTLIECTGRGGLVGGATYFPNSYFSGDRVIRSSGNGAVAFGYLKTTGSGSQTIEASGKGSLAMSFSDTPNTTCLASGNGSVQFGKGTNAIPNSLAVGGDLRFRGGYYYGTPPSVRNGDFWTAYDAPSGARSVNVRTRNTSVVL